MLQFGWPAINFLSSTRMAACPINPLLGGFRFIKISLRGEFSISSNGWPYIVSTCSYPAMPLTCIIQPQIVDYQHQ